MIADARSRFDNGPLLAESVVMLVVIRSIRLGYAQDADGLPYPRMTFASIPPQRGSRGCAEELHGQAKR